MSLVLFVGGPCRVFLDLRFGGPFGGPRVDSLGWWVCVCMHACMHACMYVCLFCVHLRDTVSVACVPAYIHMHAVHVYITVCACICIYIYISLSLSVSVCVCPTCSWIWMLCGCDEDVSSIYLTLTACQGRHRALKAETG